MISQCSQFGIQHFSLKIILWISYVFGSCIIVHHNVLTIPLLWNIFLHLVVCKIWKEHKRRNLSSLSNNSFITKEMPLSLRNCSVQRHCPSQDYRWAKPQIRSHITMVCFEVRRFLSEHSGPPVCLGRESISWASLAPATKESGPWMSLGLVASWTFSPGTLSSFCTPVAKPYREG